MLLKGYQSDVCILVTTITYFEVGDLSSLVDNVSRIGICEESLHCVLEGC